MITWEKINNKRSHSNLSYSYSCPITINFGNLVPTPMGNPQDGWESRIAHSHTHL